MHLGWAESVTVPDSRSFGLPFLLSLRSAARSLRLRGLTQNSWV